jgi:serine/threonine protein phosphatase PrpC
VGGVIQTFTRSLALLDYGVASFTAPDQNESGDRHLVKTIPGGTLLAVVDGAGHGPDAASAAQKAIATLEAHAADDPVLLVRRCHERLRTTRGAVMSLAVIQCAENSLTWLGIGNIAGLLVHPGSSYNGGCEPMLLRPGIVGNRLPLLQASVSAISPGDLIILATDGIRPNFGRRFSEEQPRAIAEDISSRCRTGLDDGLVLVARYQGSGE